MKKILSYIGPNTFFLSRGNETYSDGIFFFQSDDSSVWCLLHNIFSRVVCFQRPANPSQARKLKIPFLKFKWIQYIRKACSKTSCSHLLFFGIYIEPEPSVNVLLLWIIDFYQISMKSQVCIAKLSEKDNVFFIDIVL